MNSLIEPIVVSINAGLVLERWVGGMESVEKLVLQESKTKMSDIKMAPATLAELIKLIEDGTISGKIAKQILPKLLQVRENTPLLSLAIFWSRKNNLICQNSTQDTKELRVMVNIELRSGLSSNTG